MSFPRAEASRRPTYALPWSLAAVLALAALVRCWGLGKESLWLDEATSLIIARMDVRSVVAWAAADVHPPGREQARARHGSDRAGTGRQDEGGDRGRCGRRRVQDLSAMV